MNVYDGKEGSLNPVGTLGERVVRALVCTIKETDVTLAFDRFSTPVNLMDFLQFGTVGICNATRNICPKQRNALKKENQNSNVTTMELCLHVGMAQKR